MHDLIEKTVRFLKLKKSYRLIIVPKLTSKNRAEYTGRFKKGVLYMHDIYITMQGMQNEARSLETLVVHEFIHAWQQEKGHTDIHGKSFKRKAKQLGLVFNMSNIYLKDIDV